MARLPFFVFVLKRKAILIERKRGRSAGHKQSVLWIRKMTGKAKITSSPDLNSSEDEIRKSILDI